MHISKQLIQNSTQTNLYTHVSMIQPKLKIQFTTRVHYESFMRSYCETIHLGIVMGVAERPTSYLPILVDVDLKKDSSDYKEAPSQIYSEHHITKLVEVYQRVIREYTVDYCEKQSLCIVLEKPLYKIQREESVTYKNGFHLHFPNIVLSRDTHISQLLPKVIQEVANEGIFDDLDITAEQAIDTGYVKAPWLMYGSAKRCGMEPYRISRMYIDGLVEVNYSDVIKINNLKCSEQEFGVNIPEFMSIRSMDKETSTFQRSIHVPLEIEFKVQSDDSLKNMKGTVKDCNVIVDMIDPSRADQRNIWMDIGWTLYSIGNGSEEAFNTWLTFSKQSCKFDYNICVHEWNNMTVKNKTVGTLIYYAKMDNLTKYNLYRESQVKGVAGTLKMTPADQAKVIHARWGDLFVCSNHREQTIFEFNDHVWRVTDNGISLRKLISGWLRHSYVDICKELHRQMSEADDELERATLQKQIELCNKIINQLGQTGHKMSVFRECCELFYVTDFEHLLNTNPYTIAFKNGVFDFKTNIFGPGKPDDHISRQLPIEYLVFNEDDDAVRDVYEFLESIFPDKQLYRYFLDQFSEIFIGNNIAKKVYFWQGDGDNGKSVVQKLFESMLGTYAVKFNTSVLTGKKGGSGEPNPALARAGDGVRLTVLEEPEGDEEIYNGIMKNLAGNDSIFVRDLYERGTGKREMIPMFKMIFICNQLPKLKLADDKASWNRIRVIPFESTFCDTNVQVPDTYEEQVRQKRFPMDSSMYSKVAKMGEAFAWILIHHRLLPKMPEPDLVKAATYKYRNDNDFYTRFVKESIEESDSSTVDVHTLYITFKNWFDDGYSTRRPPEITDVENYFTKLWGLPTLSPTGKRIWNGYRVKGGQYSSGQPYI